MPSWESTEPAIISALLLAKTRRLLSERMQKYRSTVERKSKHRNFDRAAIGEQHHGLVARLREMAAEFPQQLGLGVEHVRQPARVHRDAVHQFVIEPQQSNSERGGYGRCRRAQQNHADGT